jgi:hypothetical protein
MDLHISEKELEFLNLLFRKSKGQVLHSLKKTKDATRSSSFNLLQEVIFGNCNALAKDSSTTSCFCITRANTDIEFLECVTEMVRSGLLRSLFKMCETKIEQLPDPRKQPDLFVDDLFSLFFHCTQISSGQFSLNPNSEKKFMHTNELTVNSTSSSSTPSEAKYYADESESEKSPVCRKITSQPAAKNTKKLRKRDLTRSSIPVVAQQKVKTVVAEQKVERVPLIKPKSDDHAYLADVESIGSGPLKTSTELDKWAAIYRMLKEDLREEFVDKKEIKPAAPAAIVMQPKSILKKPSASRREVQPLESTAKPAPVRLKTSLTPIRPLPQHSAHARMLENLPTELLINLKQSQGLKSKPGSLKSEQIKLVLARNQELEKNRIHNIESTRRLKETRLAEVNVNKRSEQLERKTKGQFTRQERTEMAKIKRQLLLQQQNKILQMKGII